MAVARSARAAGGNSVATVVLAAHLQRLLARDARGAHISAIAASTNSPTLRPVNFTASTKTFPTSIINGTAMLG